MNGQQNRLTAPLPPAYDTLWQSVNETRTFTVRWKYMPSEAKCCSQPFWRHSRPVLYLHLPGPRKIDALTPKLTGAAVATSPQTLWTQFLPRLLIIRQDAGKRLKWYNSVTKTTAKKHLPQATGALRWSVRTTRLPPMNSSVVEAVATNLYRKIMSSPIGSLTIYRNG